MGVRKPLTRDEYEEKVLYHINQIRHLMKRFNPEANHVSMCICNEYEWAITYADGIGQDYKISDWMYKHTESEGIGPYFESKELPNGK